MTRKLGLNLLAVGVALTALASCDQVQSRIDKLSKLSADVAKQVGGDVLGNDLGALAAMPVEARALAGTLQTPVPVQPQTLDEMLSTHGYFAVGSVIAQPKEDLTEAVVDEVDVASVDAAASAPDDASAPDMAPATAAPDLQAAPQADAAPSQAPAGAEPFSPPAPDALKAAPRATAPLTTLAVRPNAILRETTSPELRQQAQAAPRVLSRSLARSGLRVTDETLKAGREDAQMARNADNQSAQRVGDELARHDHETGWRGRRAMAVRTRLNVDRAINARQRAYKKLEDMGLSGVVSPEESGAMRIVIGVDADEVQRPGRSDQVRARCAPHFARDKAQEEPTSAPAIPRRRRCSPIPVLATECVVKALEATGDYKYVEKDYIFTNQMLRKPKKTKPGATVIPGAEPRRQAPWFPTIRSIRLQWNLREIGTAAGQSPGGAGFANFWTRAKVTGSKSVTIALVDTGIQMNHPGIQGLDPYRAGLRHGLRSRHGE